MGEGNMKNSSKNEADSDGKKSKPRGRTRETVEAILIAVTVALFLRAFVVEAFKIPSSSMVPNLKIGDHIFVNKYIYGLRIPLTYKQLVAFRSPVRGEIIVFNYPKDPTKDYIKRLVGLPGDRIRIKDKGISINGKMLSRVQRDDDEARKILDDISDRKEYIVYREKSADNISYFVIKYCNHFSGQYSYT